MPREITRPGSQGNARPWSLPNDQARLRDLEQEDLFGEAAGYCKWCDRLECECDPDE